MKKLLVRSTVFCTGLAMSLFGSLAQAHHSFAMYDTDTELNFTGKVTRFIPGANHAQIIFEIIDDEGNPILDDKGKVIQWGLETGGSAMIARQGVTVKSFSEGSVVNFTVNPLRNGKTFGVSAGPMIHCGDTLPEGGCNADTGETFMAPRD